MAEASLEVLVDGLGPAQQDHGIMHAGNPPIRSLSSGLPMLSVWPGAGAGAPCIPLSSTSTYEYVRCK